LATALVALEQPSAEGPTQTVGQKCESTPAPPIRRVLASYLAMYGAATMAVPNATIARPSASAKAVRSSRILFEGRGIRVSATIWEE
jgi:hypothetical protein